MQNLHFEGFECIEQQKKKSLSERYLLQIRDESKCDSAKVESVRDCEFDKLIAEHIVLGYNCIINLIALFYKF